MRVWKGAVVVAVSLVLLGCATKRYGRLTPVSDVESSSYSCRELDVELSKVAAFEQQVADQARFSGASVASFMGDFGIGNVMERNAAKKTAAERKVQLQNLKSSRGCDSAPVASVSTPTSLTPNASSVAAVNPTTTVAEGSSDVRYRAQQISTGMGCGTVAADPASKAGVFKASCESGHTLVVDCSGLGCRPKLQ